MCLWKFLVRLLQLLAVAALMIDEIEANLQPRHQACGLSMNNQISPAARLKLFGLGWGWGGGAHNERRTRELLGVRGDVHVLGLSPRYGTVTCNMDPELAKKRCFHVYFIFFHL